MKGCLTIALVTLLWALPHRLHAAEIAITSIEANEVIGGTVTGLSDAAEYKVIVYVLTDQWYIHPYAGQGEGLSWAPIDKDGSWRIQTVQRPFKAKKVAALVVKRAFPEPPTVSSVEAIRAEARRIRPLEGTADFGKL